MGNIAKNLLDEGVKLGVSSRGLGTIKEENGMKVVMDDFMLATAADIVADPSAPDAFVDGIMEGKEWIYANGAIHEQTIEQIRKRIHTAERSQMEERKLSAFSDYLQSF